MFVGSIKQCQHGMHLIADHRKIHTSPRLMKWRVVLGITDVDDRKFDVWSIKIVTRSEQRSAHLAIQHLAGKQHRIANLFGRQPTPGHAPQQPIVRIQRGRTSIVD